MIKIIVFDIYGTLFDINSLREDCEKVYPGNGEKIAKAWKYKLIENIHVRQLVDQYKPFSSVLCDALEYVLDRKDFDYTVKDIQTCVKGYEQLEIFPEVQHVLKEWNDIDKVIFSNANKQMIDALLKQAAIDTYFKDIIPLEGYGMYKANGNSYKILIEQLNVKKDEVLFISTNKWDIVSAQKFGFQTAWINRHLSEFEYLEVQPNYEFQSLYGLKEVLKKT